MVFLAPSASSPLSPGFCTIVYTLVLVRTRSYVRTYSRGRLPLPQSVLAKFIPYAVAYHHALHSMSRLVHCNAVVRYSYEAGANGCLASHGRTLQPNYCGELEK